LQAARTGKAITMPGLNAQYIVHSIRTNIT